MTFMPLYINDYLLHIVHCLRSVKMRFLISHVHKFYVIADSLL